MRKAETEPVQRGFTLIELMIVVVIIGILAAIAYPQYQQYVVDSKRSTCEAKLVEWSNQMERYFTENQSYQSSGNPPSLASLNIDSSCPDDSSSPAYTLSYDTGNTSNTGYALQAVPQGTQASVGTCGTLSLDETGNKGADGGVKNCW